MNKKINFDKIAFKQAIKASMPIIIGYLPTGFVFGFMLVSANYNYTIAILMSIFIYAGAGQYLAVKFFIDNSSYLHIVLMTFLINSKHLFYGLSLIEPFKKYKYARPYMIFSLTDETYAILTKPNDLGDIDITKYGFYVSVINHLSWIVGTALGALLGNIVEIDTRGMDFAMVALFIVILIEQLKVYKTKLPFMIGTFSALFVAIFISKQQILLFGSIISVFLLILLRRKINYDD